MKLKKIKPGMVIHCKTEIEAWYLLEHLSKLGFVWSSSGELLDNTYYGEYGNRTCYAVDENHKKYVTFGYFEFYENNGRDIVEFSSLIIEEKTYEDGLNEAWEFVRKISNISYKELSNIFGVSMENPWGELIDKNSASEAIAKLEAYEAEEQIKVGDVVMGNIFKGVVTGICNGRAFIMYDDGSSKEISLDKCQKTGKHIDISSILAEIGKE